MQPIACQAGRIKNTWVLALRHPRLQSVGERCTVEQCRWRSHTRNLDNGMEAAQKDTMDREEKDNMRTIRVTGKGKVNVKPDMTRIRITLEETFLEYGDTLEASAANTAELRNLLTRFDFEPSDLKTLRFNVETEFKWEDNKRVFVGYKYEHVMKVEFPSDNDRLGKILYALAESPLNPEFSLAYTVKDPEAAKNELLGKAVTDAMKKAKVLTDAAGVKLQEIQSIDYSWGEIDFEVRPMDGMVCKSLAAEVDSYDLDIEPDDIEVTDTVTVVWEIG